MAQAIDLRGLVRPQLVEATTRADGRYSMPTVRVGGPYTVQIVYVGGGGALLTRGRNTFDDDRSSTDLGGTLGLGFRFGGGDNSRVGFRIDIEDYLYNGDFGGGNDFQNDIVTSLGVSIALGGRASEDQ